MNFLIAPNAFKGTIPAEEAAQIIADKIVELPGSRCLIQPIADGGDGTCGLLEASLGLKKVNLITLNAVGQPIRGSFGWDDTNKKAYLDVSTASGIGTLESTQKKPDAASTFGTGMIIREAIRYGAEKIILGLGGSATVDMGLGILGALWMKAVGKFLFSLPDF